MNPNPSLFPYPLYSGDIYPLTLHFYQSDGTTPVDLTGITVGCTVKTDPDLPDTEASFKQDIPGDTTGTIPFAIGPLGPDSYYLDIKWWNTSQSNQRQTVVGTCYMEVNQSVTSRTVPATS